MTDPDSENAGLDSAEAAARLAAAGPNELPRAAAPGSWRLLGQVAREPMLLLLVACGTAYLALGDRNEALMLLCFVVVVIGMSFVQRRRSERSLDALRDMSAPRALVVRDGQPVRLAARELVEGDLVVLAEGDRVPADIALLGGASLMVDESMLTGESAPVARQGGVAAGAQVWAGTLVTAGTGRGRVVATGARSAIGRIGAALATLHTAPAPIQVETRVVVRRVAVGALALAAMLGVLHWWVHRDWLHGLLAGLTLAMAILPEELPVILTLFLGMGAWRLARQQVLARSLPAVELLGAVTVLCVDKTGTLTVNRMAVASLWTARGQAVPAAAAEPQHPELRALVEHAVLASHRTAFDPMETAIGRAGAQLPGPAVPGTNWQVERDYPLAPQQLAVGRVWRRPDGSRLVAAKGAPEAIVALCRLAPDRAAAVTAQVAQLAGQGWRVLGVAAAGIDVDSQRLPATLDGFDIEFLGLLALTDPLRDDVPAAVAQCRAAGVRVVMVTGDHPATALAIARQAGIVAGDGAADDCLTGDALRQLDEAGLQQRLALTDVYCRIAPEQKVRLVQALRRRGEVVAMTGDGVNDAPALKAADVGVAMGARGSDVAREAAALVLLGDEFGTLLAAVRQGRRLFANLRKALVFIVAVHVPIVGLSVLPLLWGGPMLLAPVHVLFLQLLIDPACSIVFEAEPLEPHAMRSGPRTPGAPLFDRAVLLRGLLQGSGLLALLVAVFLGFQGAGASLARTATFVALVLSNIGLIHANRSWDRPAWRAGATSNRTVLWVAVAAVLLLALVLGVAPLRVQFGFVPLDGSAWLLCAATAVLATMWFELVKRMTVAGQRRH
jgi:Ca2+-transporting ATPase